MSEVSHTSVYLLRVSFVASLYYSCIYKDTAGNAVTYELTNKSDETTKMSGHKRVSFSDKTNDKDRSRSEYSKRPRDDAKKLLWLCTG